MPFPILCFINIFSALLQPFYSLTHAPHIGAYPCLQTSFSNILSRTSQSNHRVKYLVKDFTVYSQMHRVPEAANYDLMVAIDQVENKKKHLSTSFSQTGFPLLQSFPGRLSKSREFKTENLKTHLLIFGSHVSIDQIDTISIAFSLPAIPSSRQSINMKATICKYKYF